VHHQDVQEPKAVRYAWTNNPNNPVGPYLYNQAGLPAFPFTTEVWWGSNLIVILIVIVIERPIRIKSQIYAA